MTTKEIVQKSFTINVSGTDLKESDVWMPPGWQKMFSNFCYSIDLLGGVIKKVYYSKGTLQVVAYSDRHPNAKDPINWMCMGLARHSTMVCLVYPQEIMARRRKVYDGWPPLSPRAFVEYANQLEE